MQALRYIENVASLQYDISKCTGCTLCTIVCPHAVFIMQNKKAFIADFNVCMECGACMNNCPDGAIFVEAGVGCAYGIIVGSIKGTEPSCGCGDGGPPDCC